MNLYISNNPNFKIKKNSLVAIITTTQSPHLEAYFHFIEKYINTYNNIYILDVTSEVSYRNEYSWRTYVPLRQNLIRKLRNGFFKRYFIDKKVQQLNFRKHKLVISKPSILNEKETFEILKTYSMTEFRTAAFTSCKYDINIINSISSVSAALNQFTFQFKINSADDFLIFNGRHPLEFASRKTLEKLNFHNIFYHECNNFAYKIYYTNFQIHRLHEYHELINIYKFSHRNLLDKWFEEKKLTLRNTYEKKYVTFFTSSFDEFSFAYSKPINQSLLISQLLSNCSSLPLRIRVHPNAKNKSLNDRLFWDFLKQKYPKIIVNYNENVNSYELIKKSFFTISIGSSIAPESLMLGVNHLLCGNQHIYNKLPGFYFCNELNFVSKINILYRNRFKLKFLSKNIKEFAAASQLFNKQMGSSIPLAFLGSYPFKLKSNKIFDWFIKNFRK